MAMTPPEKTAGEVLDELGVRFADLRFDDDPPGKLRSVTFRWPAGPVPTEKVRVHLKYTTALFSADRTWQEVNVRTAAVVRIERLPLPQKKKTTS